MIQYRKSQGREGNLPPRQKKKKNFFLNSCQIAKKNTGIMLLEYMEGKVDNVEEVLIMQGSVLEPKPFGFGSISNVSF